MSQQLMLSARPDAPASLAFARPIHEPFVLRDYQAASVDAGAKFLLDPGSENGIEILPTGSGKSLVIANIAARLSAPTLVFQPSKEILVQNLEKLRNYGYHPAVFSASLNRKRIANITLATIGSVVRTPDLFKTFRYVLVDECHLVNPKSGMYSDFFKALGDIKILGLTATPYRLSTDGYGGSMLKFLTRTRPRVFSRVVHYVQNSTLFSQGYLAHLTYKQVNSGFRKDRLRLNSTGADYTDDSVRTLFKELNFSDQIVRCVQRLQELRRGPALVFTRFVEEAAYVASKIPGAAIVSAETPTQLRDDILRRFKAGSIPAVCNVGVLTVGFDYPALANVILARPTMSLALYYQMVGRVMRPHPSKSTAFVIDLVDLVNSFGHIEDLTLASGPFDTYYIHSNGRQLTNVYFGTPPSCPRCHSPMSECRCPYSKNRNK